MIRKLNPLKNSKGNSIVEFALVLPILLLVLMGILEFGRAIMVSNVLHTASREGARVAAVALAGDSATVRDRVDVVLDAAHVTPSAPASIAYDIPNRSVSVTVRSDFQILSGNVLNLFGGTLPMTWPLSATTVMRYER